uniref:Ceramide kinase n=1 Tax=Kalanchoe fedtschenkoi TaxID=63787 RepID=A0A7N0V3X2_KALFE
MHIVLGSKVFLDIAQVVRWKTTLTSRVEPCVRYAASFAGYGFYGDVITESEKYRWMGPKRYDYAGTKVFLRHRSYEAEVRYLDVKSDKDAGNIESATDGNGENGRRTFWGDRKSNKVICCANCKICSSMLPPDRKLVSLASCSKEARWLRSKGRFLSVGAAVISCRNQRAPDGLVAHAHLADGFLDLVLVKDCPHASYLWHLTHLARKGGTPLDFDFVEHHKTPAFTFTSSSDESVWNLDGEAFQAHQLSAQVFRGLVTLFAPGPEV